MCCIGQRNSIEAHQLMACFVYYLAAFAGHRWSTEAGLLYIDMHKSSLLSKPTIATVVLRGLLINETKRNKRA